MIGIPLMKMRQHIKGKEIDVYLYVEKWLRCTSTMTKTGAQTNKDLWKLIKPFLINKGFLNIYGSYIGWKG